VNEIEITSALHASGNQRAGRDHIRFSLFVSLRPGKSRERAPAKFSCELSTPCFEEHNFSLESQKNCTLS
jgi:hypothetical protein